MQGKLYSSPQLAAGTNWLNPSDALSIGSGYAQYPELTTPSSWLSLTDWSNRRINDNSAAITGLGVTLYADAVPSAPAVNFGRVARVYRGNAADMVANAPEVYDGNGATYYGDATTTAGTRVITVIHDFGDLAAVTSAQISARTDSFAGWEFDSSVDGVTWVTVPRSGFIAIANGDWSDTYPATSTVTARYFRATISDDNAGSGQARVYKFELFNGATLLTPGYVGGASAPIRLEIAVTKDGSTAVGTPKFVEVGSAGGVFELGGDADLWGTTVTEAEFEAATFGFLVRRPQTVDSAYTLRRVDALVRTVWFDFVPVPEMRPAALQNALLGKQTDRDTRANPTIRTKSFAIRPVPNNENKEFVFAGDLVPGDYATVYEEGQFSTPVDPSFDEMGLLLANLIGKPVTTTVSAGVYRHTFNLNAKGQADPQHYTVQYGDPNHAEEALTAMINAFNLEWTGKRSISGSVSGFTRKVDGTLTAIQAGANCVQSLGAPSGAPTSFKLRFKGAETGAITVSGLSSSTIQTALQALSTIGSGNATVTGSGPYVVTFAGALAGVPQPIIEVASFVGGTAPAIAVSITTPGGYTEVPFNPLLAGHISAYVSPTVGGLSSAPNKVGTLLKGSFSLDGRYKPVEYTDAAQASFGAVSETGMKMVTKITVNADDANGAFETDARNRAERFARIIATGPEITAGNPYSLIIDMACKVSMIGEIQDEGEVVSRDFELSARPDASWGQTAQFVLINGVAAY